ncbi:MAG: PilZ domain-containing protein [Thermodesulfobacteriota bacterium]
MQETWSKDPATVMKELRLLIEQVTALIVYCKGGPPRRSLVRDIAEHEGSCYLVLQRPSGWTAEQPISFLLYKPEGQPIRGFSFTVTREAGERIAGPCPQEIFQIQRRRWPRVPAAADSTATLIVPGKTRFSAMAVADVSLGGMRLYGTPAYELKVGDLVGPITLKLMMEYATLDHEITVASAAVVRINPRAEGGVEVGLSFTPSDAEAEKLETYINLRGLERSAFQHG